MNPRWQKMRSGGRLARITPKRKPALAFIFIVLFLDVLGIGLIVPILPKLIEELGGGGEAHAAHIFGALAALYSLMQFVFAPMIGSLSDRFGRRPVILVSLLGGAIDYFLMGWAPVLWLFFVARAISGVAGANFSAAAAYIADVSPPEKRAANFGLIGAAFGLGFVIGPMIGGVLGDREIFGEGALRYPFYAAGGLTLLNFIYGYFVMPESLDPKNRREFSLRRSNPFSALIDLKRFPMVFGLAGALFLASVAHQVLPATWVLYTQYRFEWTSRDVGFSLGLVGIMAAIVSGGLTRIVIPKFGERRVAIFGLIVSAITFVFYGLATAGWMLLVIIFFGSLGGLSTPAVQGLVSNAIGDDEQGGVQGALTSLQSVAGVIGPLIAANLFGFFISDNAPVHLPGAAFFAGAAMIMVATLLAVRSMRRNV